MSVYWTIGGNLLYRRSQPATKAFSLRVINISSAFRLTYAATPVCNLCWELIGTALVSRKGAALLRGFVLVIPMIIMAVHNASSKSLITMCVAGNIFATDLASTSLGTYRDVLGILSAYMAVLVLFIGTITSPY